MPLEGQSVHHRMMRLGRLSARTDARMPRGTAEGAGISPAGACHDPLRSAAKLHARRFDRVSDEVDARLLERGFHALERAASGRWNARSRWNRFTVASPIRAARAK